MPGNLGESVFYALLGDIRGSSPGQTAQEEHGAERVCSGCWLVVPSQEPIQMIKSRILERHGVEPYIVWRPVGERVPRPYLVVLSVIEGHPHSSSSSYQEPGNCPAS